MVSSVSYRRNRDYTKSFKWTYELEKDLHQCYIKAKSDPRTGLHESVKATLGRKASRIKYIFIKKSKRSC